MPSEVYEAAKKAGLSWSKTLTNALIAQLAMDTKVKRAEITEEQLRVYKDAMVVLTKNLIRASSGDDGFKHPIEYAKVWANTLREVGYFTTASELIEDAKAKLAERK